METHKNSTQNVNIFIVSAHGIYSLLGFFCLKKTSANWIICSCLYLVLQCLSQQQQRRDAMFMVERGISMLHKNKKIQNQADIGRQIFLEENQIVSSLLFQFFLFLI